MYTHPIVYKEQYKDDKEQYTIKNRFTTKQITRLIFLLAIQPFISSVLVFNDKHFYVDHKSRKEKL